MSSINISSPSIVITSKETEYSGKVLNLMSKLEGVQQSTLKLIVNFKSEHLSDSEKTSFIKDSAPQLDKLANGIALIGAHQFSLQGSTFRNPEAYSQTLDSMSKMVKASYDELKTLSNNCAASLPADSKLAEVTVQESNASKTDAGTEKKSARFAWWTK
jgi:hypothetical protein